MKRGTAAKVILGKDALMDVPAGIVHGTDVILGGKAGLLNDFGGLVLSNNLMIGKKVSRGTITTITVRGQSPLVLPDAMSGSLQAVKAFGGAEQNGTPTPDTPVDIVSNNGVLKVYKNLFNRNDPTTTINAYVGLSSVGSSANIVSSTNDRSFIIKTKPNTKYTIQKLGGEAPYNRFRVSESSGFPQTGQQVTKIYEDSSSTSGLRTATVTTGNSGNYIIVYGLNGSPGTELPTFLDNFVVCEGDTINAGQIYTDGTVETLNIHGKNLLNPANIEGNIATYYTDFPTNGRVGYHLSLKAGTYTYSVGSEESTTYLRYKYNGQEWSAYASIRNNGTTQTYTNDVEIAIYSGSSGNDIENMLGRNVQVEQGSTATEYQPYYDGGTATAEMLLKVGDYQDVQSILDGVVTRNIGVKVLDGTEEWRVSGNLFYAGIATDALEDTHSCYCTHFKGVATNTSANYDNEIKVGTNATQTVNWTRVQIYPIVGTYSDVTTFKQYLAAQYNAGTPVIVIYPLATPTTESVTGQALQVTGGDNVLEITQASLNNLELEATYNSLVQLTIQEVEDANLNNNVEVTIS